MAIATDQLERLNTGTAEDVLSWGLEEFHPRMAISAAFLPEDMVVIDLAHRINPDVRVFTLDTGRLPQETYDLIDQVRGRYDINIQVMFPPRWPLTLYAGVAPPGSCCIPGLKSSSF